MTTPSVPVNNLRLQNNNLTAPLNGIVTDTSQSAFDPTSTASTQFVLDLVGVPQDFWPVGSGVVLQNQDIPGAVILCSILAYTSPNLQLLPKYSSILISPGALTGWNVTLLDEPSYSPGYRVGLVATQTALTSFSVGPGAIIDSTNTTLLVIPQTITKDLNLLWAVGTGNGGMQALAGTVAIVSGTPNLVGTGTNFTVARGLSGCSVANPTSVVTAVALDVSPGLFSTELSTTTATLSLNNVLNIVADQYSLFPMTATVRFYAIRRDSDGKVDLVFVYGGDTLALPAGYTYFALIVTLNYASSSTVAGAGLFSGFSYPQNPIFGASGANHAPGLVPDPGAVAGTTKFLREDATFAVPPGTASAPGLVLLNTLTLTGNAAVADTTSFTTTYDDYEFVLEGIVPSAANAIRMRYSFTAGGGSILATGYTNTNTLNAAGTLSGVTTTSTFIDLCAGGTVVNTATVGLDGRVTTFDTNTTARIKRTIGKVSATLTTSGVCAIDVSGNHSTTNAALTAVEFSVASGTFTTGIVKIYGWKK